MNGLLFPNCEEKGVRPSRSRKTAGSGQNGTLNNEGGELVENGLFHRREKCYSLYRG